MQGIPTASNSFHVLRSKLTNKNFRERPKLVFSISEFRFPCKLRNIWKNAFCLVADFPQVGSSKKKICKI